MTRCLFLLPTRDRRWKTKVQHVDQPIFNEVFRVRHVTHNDIDKLGLRFRLYGIGKVKDRLIGEAVIDLGELHLTQYKKFSNNTFHISDYTKKG